MTLERPELTALMLKGHIMLTATQKTLVQESFATIAPIADDKRREDTHYHSAQSTDQRRRG